MAIELPCSRAVDTLSLSFCCVQKRHVGNDNVHVVWSKHKRDYSPTTITSQFNDAHIVVYPLPNGLFRIQIFKKAKV